MSGVTVSETMPEEFAQLRDLEREMSVRGWGEKGGRAYVVIGDSAVYTWSDHKTEFPDGRLDYAIYSDSSAEAVNAFVLDTRRLSNRTLARLGLDRTDSTASRSGSSVGRSSLRGHHAPSTCPVVRALGFMRSRGVFSGPGWSPPETVRPSCRVIATIPSWPRTGRRRP